MKKKDGIYQNAKYLSGVIIALYVMILFSCGKEGTCDMEERIDFHGVKFTFPIKAYTLFALPGNIEYSRGDFITIDSISNGVCTVWHMESEDNAFPVEDSLNFLRDANIYAVSFKLFNEIGRTDREIISDLKKAYPGEYRYYEQFGSKYYLNHQDCLTVIFKRDLLYVDSEMNIESVPVVSFGYGFSEREGHNYGHSTGNKYYID